MKPWPSSSPVSCSASAGRRRPSKLQLPGGQAEVADLVDRGPGDAVGERPALLLDEEELEAVGAARGPRAGRRVRASRCRKSARAGVPDPALGAGDAPTRRRRARRQHCDVGEVGAGLRLGERDRRRSSRPAAAGRSSSARRSGPATSHPVPLPRAMMLPTLSQARASSSETRQYSRTPRPRPPSSSRSISIPK